MHDMNVMPYGSDDERNSLIDDDGVLHSATTDTHTVIAGGRAYAMTDGDRIAMDARRAAIVGEPAYGQTEAWVRTGITDRQAAGWDTAPQAMHTAAAVDDVIIAVDASASGVTGVAYVNKREGMRMAPLPPTDPHSAVFGWPDPSPHSDGFDADEYNRPINGLGTYHESDGAW